MINELEFTKKKVSYIRKSKQKALDTIVYFVNQTKNIQMKHVEVLNARDVRRC